MEFHPGLGVKSNGKSNPHASLERKSLYEVHDDVITSKPTWLGSLAYVDCCNVGGSMASFLARCKL